MRAVVRGRRRQARPVHPRARGLGPERGDQRRGLLGGVRRRPGDAASRSAPAPGSTGSRRRPPPCSRSARAPPTAASRRCATTRPARWACATTSAGTGPPAATSRSSTSRAARSSPTTSPRRCCAWSLHLRGHRARRSTLDEQGRPRGIFGRTVHESCNRAGLAEQGQFSDAARRRPLPGQARLQGPGRQVQRADPRLVERRRWLPERRRHLHGVHDARLPRQVHAVHGRRPRSACSTRGPRASRTGPSSASTCAAAGSAAHSTSSRAGARRAAS